MVTTHEAKDFVTNTVRRDSALLKDVMMVLSVVASVCSIPKLLALLLAVAAMLLPEDSARIMVERDSALLKDAVRVLSAMGSAASTMSALGNGAPQPLLQGEGVSSTAAAAQKCARWVAAPLLLKHAVSARSMVRTESASLKAAPPV